MAKLDLDWDRGTPYDNPISFNRPDTWFTLGGARGCGKSSMVEYIAVHYFNAGHCILDLYGSRDGEGLAWLRSPLPTEGRVLLLTGRGMKVLTPLGVDVKCADDFSLKDIYNYDFIISSNPLYRSPEEEYTMAAHITDKLYSRRSWRRLVVCLCREAANLYYSRLMICKDQNIAKAQMTYFIREARHMGVALAMDALRFYAVDIDIRELIDFLIIKRLGISGLPDQIHFLYKYYDADRLMTMPPDQYVLVCKSGGLARGSFQAIPWHKQEDEDILPLVGVEASISNLLPEEGFGTKEVTPLEHIELVRLRLEQLLSFDKIAGLSHRSKNTVQKHLLHHNISVEQVGTCPYCARGQSQYANTPVPKDIHDEEEGVITTINTETGKTNTIL